MPIPDTPYTRKESYLNAIATGDSGSIPETPYTREEMYLDAIVKGGGGGGGGGSTTLSGLTDVDISNPTDGQTLVYNAASGKWVNGAGGGGASLVMPNISITQTGELTATATCNMSRASIMSAIESGAICIAKITFTLDGVYRLTSAITVIEDSEDGAYVYFTTSVLAGGGDVYWFEVTVFDDTVECVVDRTNYNP